MQERTRSDRAPADAPGPSGAGALRASRALVQRRAGHPPAPSRTATGTRPPMAAIDQLRGTLLVPEHRQAAARQEQNRLCRLVRLGHTTKVLNSQPAPAERKRAPATDPGSTREGFPEPGASASASRS